MNPAQKIAFNTIIQITGKLLGAFGTLALTVLIGWKLGNEGTGQYTRIITYIGLWLVLLDFGVNGIAVKAILKKIELKRKELHKGNKEAEIGKLKTFEKETLKDYFGQTLGLRIAASILITFLALATIAFLPVSAYSNVIKVAIIVGLVQIFFRAIIVSTLVVFQAKQNYLLPNIALVMATISSVLAVYITLDLTKSLLLLVVAVSLNWVVMGLFCFGFTLFYIPNPLPRFNLFKWGKLLIHALPLGAAQILTNILMPIDIQLLQVIKQPADTIQKLGTIDAQSGYMGPATFFLGFLLTLPIFFGNAVYPLMVTKYTTDRGRFNYIAKKSLGLLYAGAGPIVVGGILIAPKIISFITGRWLPGAQEGEFDGAIPALQILLSGLVFCFLTTILIWILTVSGKQLLLTLVYTSAIVVNILTITLLLPRWGYIGCSWIIVATHLYIFILLSLLVGLLSRIWPPPADIAKATFAVVIMAIPVYFLKDQFVLVPVFVGAIVYGALSIALKIISREEVRALLRRNNSKL